MKKKFKVWISPSDQSPDRFNEMYSESEIEDSDIEGIQWYEFDTDKEVQAFLTGYTSGLGWNGDGDYKSFEKDTPMYLINGYFKGEDKDHFENYLVSSSSHLSTTIPDDDIFFYGLSHEAIKQAVKDGENTKLEFVITSYQNNWCRG